MQITFVAGNDAGKASHLAVQAFSSGSGEILTAMQNGSGDLELIGWIFQGGHVTRAATATAGTAENVALALLGRRAVTAVRSGSDHLLLISWNAPSGLQTITRLHDSGGMAGEASQIAVTPVNQTMLVTALRDGSGDLLLISWQLNANGSFTRLGDSRGQAGAVSLVTATTIGNNIVVTAVRNGSGDLELIAWRVSGDGKTIHRQNPAGATAGSVGEIALTTFRDSEGATAGVVTAVQNGSGNLELIAWGVLDLGVSGFRRLGDTGTLPPAQRPGTASHISISPSGFGPNNFLAAMRRGSGDLELIDFTLNSNGGWTRNADWGQREGTDVTETAISSFVSRAVTAIRRNDTLNVKVWQVSNSPVVAPDTTALNDWFKSALADPARSEELRRDWMKLLRQDLPLSERQKEHLSLVPPQDAKELQAAIAQVVEHGGTIHIERDSEQSPGELIVQPQATGKLQPDFSVGIFHCTFDANCRNWHCGWGPAKHK